MNIITKAFLALIFCFISITSLKANKTIVSENYLKHPHCENIKNLEASSNVSSKKQLIKVLQKQAKQLKANTLINVNYEVSIFDKRVLKAVAAKCDIEKSPELFSKNTDILAYEKKDLLNIKKNKQLFILAGVAIDNVNMDKSNSSTISNQRKQKLAFILKIGISKEYYRYYANINIATSSAILFSLDYKYNLKNNNIDLFIGPSIGMINYELEDSNTISGFAYGGQFGAMYKKYEFGFEYLSSNASQNVSNVNYKLQNRSLFYLAYRF